MSRRKLGIGLLLLSAALALGGLAMRRRRQVSGPRTVLAVGDSITASGLWAKELARLLGPGARVDVAAWGGQGTKVIAERAIPQFSKGYTDIVILAGVNDVASQRGADFVMRGLERLYQAAGAAGARVVAVEILPWAKRMDRPKFASLKKRFLGEMAQINGWIRQRPAGVSVAVDASGALGNAVQELRSEYTTDDIHPNPRGLQVLGQEIARQAFGVG